MHFNPSKFYLNGSSISFKHLQAHSAHLIEERERMNRKKEGENGVVILHFVHLDSNPLADSV